MKCLLTTSVFLLLAIQAQATPIQLLLESDANAAGGNEIFLATYDTYTDLIDSNLSSGTFSQINVGSNFSVGGYTYEVVSVPAPGTFALLGIGLAGMGLARRRRTL